MRNLLIASLVLPPAVVATALAPAAAAQTLPAVSAALDPLVDGQKVSGMVTLASKDGRIVHAEARGVQSWSTNTPVAMNSIFRAFSMTKPVTAVAMMILRDEGKWRPDDPITKFLPELAGIKVFKGPDRNGAPILEAPRTMPTIGQLLTHSAGFGYGIGPGYVNDEYRRVDPLVAASGAEFVRKVALLPLYYEPGTRWQYSLSMDLQGVIVERISGQSLPDFMRQRIFAPLGMADTGFQVPAEKRGRFVAFYTGDGPRSPEVDLAASGALKILASDFATQPGFANGGAGLVTTAGDYLRFAQMLLGCGTLDGVRIISRRAAAEMMSNHLPAALTKGGYGIGTQNIRPGYEFGYNGVVVTDPKRAGVDLGRGSYLWDGAAGTWFWVDPANRIVFIGLIQRLMSRGGMPNPKQLSQHAIREALIAGRPSRP